LSCRLTAHKVDNLKSAVLQRLAGTAPVFNRRYHDFARHHGFTIVGRVESGVGYVKKNFLEGIEPTDFNSIQAAAQVWLDHMRRTDSGFMSQWY
jgi:hypothetical protein